ncbi:hypothetical protein M758_UG145100 [Ceratodon purpureus]|nr:hypothetical protein M758_UG145100 [Ceratodon purpureus]
MQITLPDHTDNVYESSGRVHVPPTQAREAVREAQRQKNPPCRCSIGFRRTSPLGEGVVPLNLDVRTPVVNSDTLCNAGIVAEEVEPKPTSYCAIRFHAENPHARDKYKNKGCPFSITGSLLEDNADKDGSIEGDSDEDVVSALPVSVDFEVQRSVEAEIVSGTDNSVGREMDVEEETDMQLGVWGANGRAPDEENMEDGPEDMDIDRVNVTTDGGDGNGHAVNDLQQGSEGYFF